MAGEPARPIPQPLQGRVFGPSAVQGSPRDLGGEPKRREQRSPSPALSECGPHRGTVAGEAASAGTVTRHSPDAAGTSGCNGSRWQQRYGGSRAAGASTIGTTTRHGRMHSARLGFTGIDRRSLRALTKPAGSRVADHDVHPGPNFDEHCDRGAKGQRVVAPPPRASWSDRAPAGRREAKVDLEQRAIAGDRAEVAALSPVPASERSTSASLVRSTLPARESGCERPGYPAQLALEGRQGVGGSRPRVAIHAPPLTRVPSCSCGLRHLDWSRRLYPRRGCGRPGHAPHRVAPTSSSTSPTSRRRRWTPWVERARRHVRRSALSCRSTGDRQGAAGAAA